MPDSLAPPPADNSPWAELFSDFRRHLALERAYSKNTAYAYSLDTREFLDWCARSGTDPVTVSPKNLEDYILQLKTQKKLAARSLFRKMESLKSFYRYLAVERKITVLPTRKFKMPHMPARLPQWLTQAEMAKLLSYPAEGFAMLRTAAIVEFFYASGIRISELLGLRLESLNMEQGWVLVQGKGGKERMVPVHERALQRLRRYLEARSQRFGGRNPGSEIFLNKFGRKLSRVQAWKDVAALGRLAELERKLHPHLFRHTFASHLLQGGADLRSLQDLRGHASLATTQIYTHLERADLKRLHEKFHPRS